MDPKPKIVSMAGDATVLTGTREHPEPRPVPGEVAKPWHVCTIPGCRHNSCPAKLRAWGWYGPRYMCNDPDCDHEDCLPRRRATEDHQPFGVPYKGPALPQHVVDMDDKPLGAPMYAARDEAGEWRLWPARDLDA